MDNATIKPCADRPTPAASSNDAVLQLPWLERTLLWSIRTWAAYHDAPQAVWWYLERAFTEASIRPALEPFAQLMLNLFAEPARGLDIRCVRCLRLGRDEHELLQLLGEAMHQPLQHIAQRLRRLMAPAVAQQSARVAQQLMQIIGNAGLYMQQAPSARPHTGQARTDAAIWPPGYHLTNALPH